MPLGWPSPSNQSLLLVPGAYDHPRASFHLCRAFRWALRRGRFGPCGQGSAVTKFIIGGKRPVRSLRARVRGLLPPLSRPRPSAPGFPAAYRPSRRVSCLPLLAVRALKERRAPPLCLLLASADFCAAVKTPRGSLPRPFSLVEDTAQVSLGKPGRLPRLTPDLLLWPPEGMGLVSMRPLARPHPPHVWFLFARPRFYSCASLRLSLAIEPLLFASPSPPPGWTGGFHPQALGHARRI